MNSIRPEPQFSVFVAAEEENSFASRGHRIVAHSLRARRRAVRVRLYSMAIIAKGRVLRERCNRKRIG